MNELKDEMKNQIMNELRQEIEEKFENIKKDLDDKFEFPLIDDKMEDSPEGKMDIRGHSQA
jgi:hypothetical protein